MLERLEAFMLNTRHPQPPAKCKLLEPSFPDRGGWLQSPVHHAQSGAERDSSSKSRSRPTRERRRRSQRQVVNGGRKEGRKEGGLGGKERRRSKRSASE